MWTKRLLASSKPKINARTLNAIWPLLCLVPEQVSISANSTTIMTQVWALLTSQIGGSVALQRSNPKWISAQSLGLACCQSPPFSRTRQRKEDKRQIRTPFGQTVRQTTSAFLNVGPHKSVITQIYMIYEDVQVDVCSSPNLWSYAKSQFLQALCEVAVTHVNNLSPAGFLFFLRGEAGYRRLCTALE